MATGDTIVIFRRRHRDHGGHDEVDVFFGREGYTRSRAGTLTFAEGEYRQFLLALKLDHFVCSAVEPDDGNRPEGWDEVEDGQVP